VQVELPVLEQWSVRGKDRYSGFLIQPGKKEGQFMETGKHCTRSRDGKTITTAANYGGETIPGKVYGRTYRLGAPREVNAQ